MNRLVGARLLERNRCEFRVWAPYRDRVELHIVEPAEQRIAMTRDDDGYHEACVATAALSGCASRSDAEAGGAEAGFAGGAAEGSGTYTGIRYFYTVDGVDRPDPASRYQPEGVHGPSEVVSSDFEWHDASWRGLALEDYVVYELHAGTFTQGGTFDAVIEHLDALKELGITAIELLPIGQFPGTRNWGYDGVYVHAVQASYGGARGLKRLVDACHQRGLALILDVVYNHLGPEGNYVAQFGPYFTDRYKTPWGNALNFDGAHSDHVRAFFIQSALAWIDEFHVDALRVDAVHAIVDHSAQPFLQDLTKAVRARGDQLGRRVYTIAESDLNDPRVITPAAQLGLGFDSQWSDDFHHSLHAILTGERDGYYEGFGRVSDFARVFETGYFFIGQHSTYRKRKYGERPNTTDGRKFIVYAQNHDQVGNRMLGDRLSTLVGYERLALAAAAVVLSPFIPMLFMGEEYGEKAPFQYFTSHSDADLIEAVRKGRLEEFDDFDWEGDPPDPHDESTFERSRLRWESLDDDGHRMLYRLYRELLRIRRETPALHTLDLSVVETQADDEQMALIVKRENTLIAFNFSEHAVTTPLRFAPAAWKSLMDTGAKLEGNQLTLPPLAFGVFTT
jgi:maltooligosyltrehalose trehalohydrolase